MEGKTLQNVLDTTLLQKIQDLLSITTGLAYHIVDYKGCPVSAFSDFSSFCSTIRSCEEGRKICVDINARSGFEAALQGKPFLFQCPLGLVELAVPIIINNTFLGAICFGQVRTDKKQIPSLKGSMNATKMFEKIPILKIYYEQIPILPYEKLEAIGELVFVLVNQLVEKCSLQMLQETLNFQKILLKRQVEKIKELEQELTEAQRKEYQMEIYSMSVYHGMNLLSKLAFLENAENTQEMAYILIEYYKKMADRKTMTTLKGEIELLDYYQKMTKKRFGDRIKWQIEIEEIAEQMSFPANIILLCAEYCVLYGVCPKKEGGRITLQCFYKKGKYKILFCHDGVILPQKTIYDIIQCHKNSEMLFDGLLYRAIKIAKAVYQKNCSIRIESTEEKTVIAFEIISV